MTSDGSPRPPAATTPPTRLVDRAPRSLGPDEVGHTLLAGASDRFSVWFPEPPVGTGTVTMLVPRAGVLRELPIT